MIELTLSVSKHDFCGVYPFGLCDECKAGFCPICYEIQGAEQE